MHNAKRYVTAYADDFTPHVFWANSREEAKVIAASKGQPLFLLRHRGDAPGQMRRQLSSFNPYRTWAVFYGGMPIGEVTHMPQHILQETNPEMAWFARVYVPAIDKPDLKLAGAGVYPRMHQALAGVYAAYSHILLQLERAKARRAQKPIP